MRIIAATVLKRHAIGVKDLVARLGHRRAEVLSDLPWERTQRVASWTAESRAVYVDVASNEPEETGPLLYTRRDGGVACFTGYVNGVDEMRLRLGPLTPDEIANFSGCFAFVLAEDDRVVGVTNVHRLQPLYVADGADVIVLSNSARTASSLAALSDRSPPLAALIGLSGPGFMLDDRTPFPGVEAVPADSYIAIDTHGPMARRLPPWEIDPKDPDRVVEMLCEAVVGAAVDVVGAGSSSAVVHLTGGKDSRAAAAAVKAAGISFAGVTVGVESHPDVIIGRRLASVLEVPHEVRQPGISALGAVVVDPVARARNTLRGCDGMLTAYEAVQLSGEYRIHDVTLGGHGGELLRGGYGYLVPSGNIAQARRRLELRIGPHRDLLKEEAKAELDEIAAPWLEAVSADPLQALERFYRELRAGRWHAVANSIYGVSGPRRSILADNRVVRVASRASLDYTASERLPHALIHRLTPSLCFVPLTPKRWNFEASGPTPECNAGEWHDRGPLPIEAQTAWNWRVLYPPEMHEHFKEVILSAPLYDKLLCRDRVERLLTETAVDRTAPQAKLVWSLYTVSHLLTDVGVFGASAEGPKFRITLPTLHRGRWPRRHQI